MSEKLRDLEQKSAMATGFTIGGVVGCLLMHLVNLGSPKAVDSAKLYDEETPRAIRLEREGRDQILVQEDPNSRDYIDLEEYIKSLPRSYRDEERERILDIVD